MDITTIIIGLVILVASAILHEIMHGVVADRLGDPTARLMGRLTLNPLPHIDPFLSIIVPILTYLVSQGTFVFGAAKPVPVNPLNLHDGKKDMALVALAGPATNLVIAVLAALILKVLPPETFIQNVFFMIVLYNLILGFINLIPIPPLDGSKVLTIIMPDTIAREYLSIERYGFIILLILLYFPIPFFNVTSFLDGLISSALKLLGIS